MLSLSEYRNRADRLADLLPWAALIAPGIVLNKDGSFQRSFRFRGPDLESATEAELVGLCARANNALKRLGSGWGLFFEAERLEAQDYPQSDFPDAASWIVDAERRAAFADGGQGRHFESRYHLTLLYMPPPDAQARTEMALLDSDRKGEGDDGTRNWRQEQARFRDETERVLDLLGGFLPEIRILPDGSSVEIDNLPATDTAGYAGLEDEVDHHTWRLIKGIALATLLGVGTELNLGSNERDLVRAIRESTQQNVNRAGQRITEKNLNVQPTITVRPGWPLRVIVHRDLVLRPYQG